MMISRWRPSWWSNEVHGSAWDRVKEAMRRDWSQTKHEMHVGGHETSQSVTDTLKQAAGEQHLPTINQVNPHRLISEWSDAELPYRYGYAARQQYGAEHPQWSEELEAKLQDEWTTAQDRIAYDWESAMHLVRRGYEHQGGGRP
jgi:hypothetical protein